MASTLAERTRPTRQSLRGLDFLNFFLANVQGGAGPFLATYLMASHNWNPAQIGVAMSIMGIATLVAQTPCGALVDHVSAKRLLIVLATAAMAASCTAITLIPNSFIYVSQCVNGVAAAIFPSAIAAITLGMVGQERLAARTGRNQVFNHAGKIAAAALTGLVGHFWGHDWFFYLVALNGAAGIASTLVIRGNDIDYLRARAAAPSKKTGAVGASRIRTLLTDHRILVFASIVTLFHFANAAMLPLAGQLVTRTDQSFASIGMAACVIAAQMVMLPVAWLSGALANRWGRKPLFLIGFAALTTRGLLYTLSDHPFFVLFVQLFDGIGQGIYGVVSVIVVADITRNTGRYNLVLGAVGTAKSVGATLSNVIAGYIVHTWGFNSGFVFLACLAAAGFIIYYCFLPETRESRQVELLTEA
ncbi:MAG: MFS transporter [Desulfomonilaceae bacterium]